MPTIRTGDIQTYYEERGEGPPLVLVHGAVLDHGQWGPQLDSLSDEFRVIAYDVRGHGRTGPSAKDRYTVDLLAEDLAAFVDGLGLDRPVICGLSTGGCIAQTYAARSPDRLSALVLADTFTPRRLDWRERLQFAFLRAAVYPVRLVGYRRVERVMVWLQERFQKGAGGDYEKVEALREGAPSMTTTEFTKVIRALTRFHESDIDLSTITVPTLVLYGEHEPAFIRRHVPVFEASLPDVTVREVPGAGHASNLDSPEFFADAVRGFLAERAPLTPV